MKFVLLVTICILGNALCETHEQQKDYSEVLVNTLKDSAEEVEALIRNAEVTSEKGSKAMLIHANSLNFDIHYILDCLQYLVYEYKEESMALQETVLNLNTITNKLENSFQNATRVVKFQLQRSVQSIVQEAESLQKIIKDSQNHLYRSNVLRSLDDMVNTIYKLHIRASIRTAPIKVIPKTLIKVARWAINLFLSHMNSEDVNVQNDIIQYSAKTSSEISNAANLMKDLIFTYSTDKEDEVKEILYSLGKICHDNEEVLHNETSFKKIYSQFRNTVLNVFEQLSKIVDVGFSDNGIVLKDENLIYVVFPEIYAQTNKLMRNLERTYDNHNDFNSN